MTTTILLVTLIICLIPIEILLAKKKIHFRFTLFTLAFITQMGAILMLCIKHA